MKPRLYGVTKRYAVRLNGPKLIGLNGLASRSTLSPMKAKRLNATAAFVLLLIPMSCFAQDVVRLNASDAREGDRFGSSVALHLDTIVVGASRDDHGGNDDAGSAYVFSRHLGGVDNWGQVIKLTASDADADDLFGFAVSVHGDIAIVGAVGTDDGGSGSGSAYVFSRHQGGPDNWGQLTELTAFDAAPGDAFGYSVSLHGDTVVVGARGHDGNRGAAYLFSRNQGGVNSWGQVTKLTVADAASGDFFGFSVSLHGETVVIGASGVNSISGIDTGAAYLFSRDQGGSDNWGQVLQLTASDGVPLDEFGRSVSVHGDLAVIGSWLDNDGGTHSGSAYLFSRHHGGIDNWGEVKKLTASDASTADFFGEAVSVHEQTVLVGATNSDSFAMETGAVYLYSRTEGGVNNWGEVTKLTVSNLEQGDSFGVSIAQDMSTAVIGAEWSDYRSMTTGLAYVLFGGPIGDLIFQDSLE